MTWLMSLLSELNIVVAKVPILWVDNVSAIALASNPVLYARTKHIKLDFHFVRERIETKVLQVQYVPSIDQVTDIFIKLLGLQFFTRLKNKLHATSLASLELRGLLDELVNYFYIPCTSVSILASIGQVFQS